MLAMVAAKIPVLVQGSVGFCAKIDDIGRAMVLRAGQIRPQWRG